MRHRPPFLRAFGRFDPEGRGEMLASDVREWLLLSPRDW